MEDDSGLELSLGLPCGGSSVKPKSKNGSSSDIRAEEVGKGGKVVDDFKSIFDAAGPQKPDSVAGARRSDSSRPEENFFSDLSKAKEDNNASLNLNGGGFWASTSNKPIEIEDDNRLEVVNKRKMSFDDIRNLKKQDSDVHHANLHDKARTSHISITEDGSTAENEDVADSEAENSTSRPISHHSDNSKGFIRVGTSSDAPKEIRGVADSSAADFNGQKRVPGLSEKDFKLANMTYGASFSAQPVNLMNVPYPSQAKESNSVGAPNPQRLMHVMPATAGERSGGQPVSNGSLPVMFGYPSVQIPMLDKDNSWGLVSRPQQLHPSFAGRGPPNSAALHMISGNIPEAMQFEGRPLERTKGDGKLRVTEEGGSSSQPEDVKGSSNNLRAKDLPDQSPAGEGSTIDFSNIKPGLSAEVKFGGCGSYPNLPWVSTTGSGPNGRTISGVTYRYSTNQIRIVCACHGSHMSPEEFVRHANEDLANPEGSAVLGTVGNGNPATSSHG